MKAAKDAGRALDQTGAKAANLGTQAKVGGNNLSAAFGATGGALGVSRGLAGIGDGFRNANSGMALFSASQALLDIGRLGSDMGAVSSATGAAGGAFSKLGAIIKANPLLAIAGVIAGAAAAMSLFGKETAKAATEFDKLAEAQRVAGLSEETKSFLGINTASARGQTLGGIEKFAGTIGDSKNPLFGKNFSLRDLAKGSGQPLGDVFGALGDSGGSLLRGTTTYNKFTGGGGQAGRFETRSRALTEDEQSKVLIGDREVSPDVARLILRKLYGDLRDSIEEQSKSESATAAGGPGSAIGPEVTAYYGEAYGPLSPGGEVAQLQKIARQRAALAPGIGPGSVGNSGIGDGVNFGQVNNDFSGARLKEQETSFFAGQSEAAARSADQASRRMDELIRQGERFGSTIGDAFFNVASGAQGLRQAIAAIVSDLARAGARNGFAALFGQMSKGFGQTAVQANPGVDPAPLAPNE